MLYVNGLPLVLFELKNPYSEKPTVDEALNQVRHYTHEIPQVFDYNALVVVSDGVTTLHGMWTAPDEWFAPWKSINGHDVEPNTTGSMKTLVEGLLPKDRLLEYIRDFIVFEVVNEKITKKGARYHQFFAVRLAAAKAIATYRKRKTLGLAAADRRLGVIWHTTGSGKSLSMAFLVAMLRRAPELENPTFVIEVDRNDLDDQLHDQFVAARSLVGDVKQAESVDHLRELLATEGGEVIFTTIEKFQLKTVDRGRDGASPALAAGQHHPDRRRGASLAVRLRGRLRPCGQPGAAQRAAARLHRHAGQPARGRHGRGLRRRHPHLRHRPVAGRSRHRADLLRAAAGQAAPDETRPGCRAARGARRPASGRPGTAQGPLGCAGGSCPDESPRRALAADLLAHFLDRTATLQGKAMVVCMERENCVRLYEALTGLPGCPEIKIVMTGNLGEDPDEWSERGYLTTKASATRSSSAWWTPTIR